MGTNDDANVDPENLQNQLSEIKSAIGLAERYPGQRRLWLRYGIVIGVVSVLAQLVFVFVTDGPGLLYLGLWVSYALITGLSLLRLAAGMPRDAGNATTPSWRVLYGTLVLAYVLVALQSEPVISGASQGLSPATFAPLNGAWAYSLIVSVSGIGFLFAGNALRAYRIRRRDRWVFYGAGIWMLVFAVVFTNLALFRQLGYGLFGVVFFLYAVGAYAFLGRSSGEG